MRFPKDNECRYKARLAVCVTVFAALIGACTIIGCSKSAPGAFLAMDNIKIEGDIEQAATMYYCVYGEWPNSMEQLRTPRSGGDQEFTNMLSYDIARIDPEASSCKIDFTTKPDGSLSIEILGPGPGDKVSEAMGIPTKISHAGK